MVRELKEVLEVLQSVGVDEAVIEPIDNNSCRVRAASKDGNIVIHDTIEESLSEYTMGIPSVRGLLSRINLFDVEKASINITSEDDDTAMDLTIKQGRKKATFRFSNPTRVLAPSQIPTSNESDVIKFSPEYVQYLSKAISAMSHTGSKEERAISVHGDGTEVSIKIYDGESDSFNEQLELPIETNKGVWEVAPFLKVMTKASEYNDSAQFTINDYNIITFDLAIMSVMIAPMPS